MNRSKIGALFISFVVMWCLCGCNQTLVLFEDDFENNDCLGKWVIGGRQLEGTNIANCELRGGNIKGHLLKISFTEIAVSPDCEAFPFSPNLNFIFDMEVRASSTSGFPSNYYGCSGAYFQFYNSEDDLLGTVAYIAATTQYPFDIVGDDPTSAAIQVGQNVSSHYSLTMEELLSQIDIDETDIATVNLIFQTYSSTRPNPYVEAELWVDNVIVAMIL